MGKDSLSLLLIDGAQTNYHNVRQLLNQIGEPLARAFNLEWARNLEEASLKKSQGDYDAYLLNSKVPEFISWQPQVNPKPVILLTEDPATGINALAHGISDYLVEAQLNAVLLEHSLRLSLALGQTKIQLQQSQINQASVTEAGRQKRNRREGLLNSIFAHSPDGIIIVDGGGIIVFVNEAATKLLNRSLLTGSEFGIPLVSKDNTQIEVVRPDGRVTTLQMSVGKTECRGSPAHVVILRDITEDIDYQQALAESERRYATLAESVPVGLYRNDAEGNCVYINEKTSEILDITFAECLGRGWVNRLHPDDLERVLQSWGRALATKSFWQEEYRFLHRDGTVVWVYVQCKFTFNEGGEKTGSIGSLTDITERKKLELALAESQQMFRDLAANLPGVILRHLERAGGSKQITYISNGGCEKIWEVEAPQVEADASLIWQMVHPDDLPQVQSSLALAGEKLGDWQCEWRIITPSGRQKWLRGAGKPQKQANGDLIWNLLVVDISDRHRAEEQIRQSEASLRMALEVAGMFSWEMDLKNLDLESWERHLEAPWLEQANEGPAACSEQLPVHPEDWPALRRGFEQAIASGGELEVECRLLFAGQEPLWHLVKGRFLNGKARRGGKILGIAFNLHQSKKTEEKLRQSETRYRHLVESLPGIIYSFSSLKGGYYFSSQVESILGYAKIELIESGWLWHDSIHPEDIAMVDRAIADSLEGKSFELEYRIQDRQGKWHWFYDRSISSRVEGQEILIDGLAIDITERKEMEIALQASEARFRQIVEYINEILYISKPRSLEIIYISPGYEKIWGRPCESLYENPLSWLDLVHPDDLPALKASLEAEKQGRELNRQYRIIREDGQLRWLRERNFTVVGGDGQVTQIVGFVQDITQEKEAELQLKYRLNLERALAEVSRLLVSDREANFSDILAILGQTVRADRAFLVIYQDNTFLKGIETGHLFSVKWMREGLGNELEDYRNLDLSIFPWCQEKLARKENIVVTDVQSLPPSAASFQQSLQLLGIRSLIATPIYAKSNQLWGTIGFETFSENHKQWSDNDTQMLGIAGNLIYNYCDRRHSALILAEKEENFRAIFEQAAVGIAILSPDGYLRQFNHKFAAITGYQVSELGGKYFPHLSYREGSENFLFPFAQLLAGKDTYYSVERQFLRPDGKLKWINSTFSLVRQPNRGEPNYLLVIVEDIDERKRSEEQLKYRLQVETTLAHISQQLATDGDANLEEILGIIGEVLVADRVFLHKLAPDGRQGSLQVEWYGGSRGPTRDKFPHLLGELFSRQGSQADGDHHQSHIVIHNSERLPRQLRGLRAYFDQFGIASLVCVPIFADNCRFWGYIGFELVKYNHSLSPQEVEINLQMLRLLGEMIYAYLARQESERALRESESRYRGIVEDQTELICRFLPDGTLTFVNNAYCRYFKEEKANLIGKNFFSFIFPEDAKRIKENLAKIISQNGGTEIFFQEERVMVEGQIRWQSWTNRAICDRKGKIIEFQALGEDITQRKMTEVALIESEERFRSIFEKAPVGIALVEPDGNVLAFNQVFIEFFGYGSSDFLSLNLHELTHGDDLPSSLEYIQSLFAGEIEFFTIDQRYKIKNGGIKWGNLTCTLVRDSQKPTKYFIVILDDIHTRKQTQIMLEEAKQKAEEANQAKSIFLANMSHELRTPLNAILGFTQLMNASSELSPQHQEYVDIINRAGEHLLSSVNQILDLSKIESGKTNLNVESFDLYHLLDSIAQMFMVDITAKNLELKVTKEQDVPQYIKTDQSKLRSVLINLINNAIKFTQQGSIHLKARCKPLQSKLNLLFAIEDTGIGIPQAEMLHLFEVFFQAKSGQKSGEGTGLGLAISKRFVNLMGGDIKVRSTLNQGSIFTFNIICESARVDDISPHQLSERRVVSGLQPNQPRHRILIVANRIIDRKLLINLLQPVGFELKETPLGREAISLYKQWRPALILIDVNMDIRQSSQAIRDIRLEQANNTSKIIIIALTASMFKSDWDYLLSLGCDDVLPKPLKLNELWEKIEKNLEISFNYPEKPPKDRLFTFNPFKQINPSDLLIMPPEWREKLYDAALGARGKTISSLIQEIPADKVDIIRSLEFLLKHLNFQEIARLTNLDS